VHGDLHLLVKVLHAEAQAVEAQFPEHGQALCGDGARVDLDRIFAARFHAEMLAQQGHQRAQLVVGEEGGRAAPQVQLADGLALAAMGRMQGHLACQVVQVDGGAIVVARHDLVAGAVVAQRLAERHMHIQRQRHGARCGTRFALLKRQDIVLGTESLYETVGRGERGVSGPRYVEATQQLWGDSGHGCFPLMSSTVPQPIGRVLDSHQELFSAVLRQFDPTHRHPRGHRRHSVVPLMFTP
jgi:hypothetical protein